MSAWHGIVVATTLPLKEDLSIDYDRFQNHVRFLAENGADGIAPNGSLGEYQVLTTEERARIVELAVEAAPEGFSIVPGVGAYGADESRRWAEQAREAGAHAVLALPPNSYRANDAEVVDHYTEVAKAGLPIVAYNNPFDTRVDLTPELLAELSEIPEVVAVKEFSSDIRRITSIRRAAPSLDVLAGSDDAVLESLLMGAVGWIGGYSNAIPQLCAKLYKLGIEGNVSEARKLYDLLQPAFLWDTKHTFVQAIKLSQEVAGIYGGPTRAPRRPLSDEERAQVIKDMELALTAS
ncbi:dihydrodipicolinate synthase [Arthrobacter crystallopoietes BAB-32]|uniref:Dihydrodipicolinate synthase n=1 Tax=Arthrobacter crystallopoietes BAB-32 TaxID=1246476 RepID=N1V0H8_9MICC|nr:dihydrodipicolinate synthase family protein [Arthrobacter crystallopoietes]EMY36161.1 dihydrodipicolinate synthase [Arthrobacter crystallopoietes BAB-32]